MQRSDLKNKSARFSGKSPYNYSAQEVGFPLIPERAPESVQNQLVAQKRRFCALLGALSGIGGNPTFGKFQKAPVQRAPLNPTRISLEFSDCHLRISLEFY